MKTPLDPATAAQVVIWGGLVIGLVFGAVGQVSRFCIRGAIADWVGLRSPARLLSWMLAVAVACVAVQALIALQLFEPARATPWSTRFLWASYLVGGTAFGFGMILAGGCPQRSLVKAGSGDLKAVVTLIVTAIAALMTLRGAFAGLRVSLLDRWSIPLSTPQDLGSIASVALPLPAGMLRWLIALALLAAAAWAVWRHRRHMGRAHWLGGILVGLLVPLAYFLTGNIGFIPEHPETLEAAWMGTQSRRPEALSFAAPLAHSLDLLTLWSDKGTVASFGVMLALGVLAGSFAISKLRNDFRLLSFRTPQELVSHLAGSVLMGVGGVTAVGCSIGNGVTGLAMLSAGATLAVGGIVAGALLAVRVQQHRLRNAEPEFSTRQAT
jgi:uncharacterized protein